MPSRGYPDWTTPTTHVPTGGLIGLEELAARLKSIVPWDLKGNILLADGFESEETEWTLDETGGNSLTSRSSRHKFAGDWAIKFFIDDVINAAASIDRYLAYPGAVKLAIMGMFYFDEDAQIIELAPIISTLLNSYTPRLSFNATTHDLYILDENGAPQVIDSNLQVGYSVAAWFPLRLDIDLATGYYLKAHVANHEYDLSTYPMRDTGGASDERLWVMTRGRTETSSGFTMYTDNVVVAKNVP